MPNDFYAEDTMKNFAPAAVEAVSLDGIIYGYPRNMETYLLYYNKDLVKEERSGLMDSIIAFAKNYNDAKNNKFGFLYEVNNFYTTMPLWPATALMSSAKTAPIRPISAWLRRKR